MCRSIGSTQIASQERICKSRKPFLAVEFCTIKNTVKSGKYDLAVLFSLPFCIAKMTFVILRVTISKSKTYPQNGFCQFCYVNVIRKYHKKRKKMCFMVQNKLKINTMKTEKNNNFMVLKMSKKSTIKHKSHLNNWS